jgi:alkylation response protein AidB-like acyl-CoA dehydrogenase
MVTNPDPLRPGDEIMAPPNLLAAARQLRSSIDANAAKTAGSPVPPETVDALRQAGLFGAMTPRELGGAELPLVDAIEVFAEVSRADGSAGWCLMAGASAVAYFGAYCESEFVDKLFAAGVPLVAGQFAPNGTGVPEAGGYRVSGSYQFGSGIHYAEWVGAGFLVHPPQGSEAPARYLFGVVPRSEVELGGNWDVLGLGATASFDYAIHDALVPDGATFLFAAPTRRRGGPVYELGVMAQTAAGHAGFAMGVTRRALDELGALARTKVRMGAGAFLKDDERFLEALGTLESRYHAACAWVRESFAAIEGSAVETGRLDPGQNNAVRQATVHVTQEGADIVRRAYLLAGTTALRDGPLQRCFRDIHAGSQHFFASPASTLDYARDCLATAPESALDA